MTSADEAGPDSADAAEPDLDLDVRAMRAWVEPADRGEPDGDVVLVATDGDTRVRMTSGAGGKADLAIHGAERLAAAAEQYVEALRLRINPRRSPVASPWTWPMRETRDHEEARLFADREFHGPLNGP